MPSKFGDFPKSHEKKRHFFNVEILLDFEVPTVPSVSGEGTRSRRPMYLRIFSLPTIPAVKNNSAVMGSQGRFGY